MPVALMDPILPAGSTGADEGPTEEELSRNKDRFEIELEVSFLSSFVSLVTAHPANHRRRIVHTMSRLSKLPA